MKNFTMFATLFMLTVVTSPAKVLIYRGAIRSVSDTESALPKLTHYFQIFDPEEGVIAAVSVLAINNQKVIVPIPPSAFRFTEAPLSAGRTATIVSVALVNGGSDDFFQNVMIHFRGTNVSLKVNSGLDNVATFPRVFAGLGLNDHAFDGEGSFTEQRIILSYQQGRTVAANDLNQTAQQTLDGLVAELKAKGFVLLNN
jgi:hypothetical protein